MLDPAIGHLIVLGGALLFASAAAHKLRGFGAFTEVFVAFGALPAAWARRLAWLIPCLELTIAAGLAAERDNRAALVAAIGLLLVYASAIALNLARGRRDLDCGCGSYRNRRPIAAWMVWRNVGLAAALGFAALPWSQRTGRPAGPADRRGRIERRRASVYGGRPAARRDCAESPGDAGYAVTALAVSNVILWVVVVALALALLAVVRQLGVLHERIAPVGALMLANGLKVGESAPRLEVQDIDARMLTVGAVRADERATLLVFVSPTCPVCKALLPVLKSSLGSERDWLDIVLASDGEIAGQREFVRVQRLGEFPFIVSAPLGIAYQVSRLPFAALIDSQGVLRARGIVNSREHLESLFEAKRLGFASIQDYFEAAAKRQAA